MGEEDMRRHSRKEGRECRVTKSICENVRAVPVCRFIVVSGASRVLLPSVHTYMWVKLEQVFVCVDIPGVR